MQRFATIYLISIIFWHGCLLFTDCWREAP